MKMRPLSITLMLVVLILNSCKEQKSDRHNDITFSKLLTDNRIDPLGIDNIKPGFTWIAESDIPENYQTAYQILVSSTPFLLDKNEGDIWDSGKVSSEQSINIKYNGPEVKSRKRYFWKVRIWDKSENSSKYSKTAKWEMGLLNPRLWRADWISAPRLFDWSKRDQQRKQIAKDAPPEREEPAPIFRKEFIIDGKAKSARAYISGLGYYELYINGQKVGNNILDPAFTAYDKNVLYVTHDITEYLNDSLNAVGVMLGNGWYNMFSRGVWSFDRSPWRADPTFQLQIRIANSMGTIQQVLSDTSWTCSPGPVIFNSIRQGEEYDATLEQSGWSIPGFFENHWFPVRKVRGPEGKMVAQTLPPIKIFKKIKPKRIHKTPDNTMVCDFGQNMAGFIEFSANTTAGRRIKFKYGEKLYPDGSVDQRNIDGLVAESSFQTDVYITKGGGPESWHPRFTYHGFQYVEIEGFDELAMNNIMACAVGTSMLKTGTFSSSNELLNSIQSATEWSFMNNFHGYPTDCPHREKNGWTGDAQLASDMALYNYDVVNSYDKWLNDIVDSQLPTGMVSAIVPTGGWGYYWGNGPAWDYALIILPWKIYVYTGDREILQKYYPAMKRYIEFLSKTAEDNIVRWGLGDWVPVRASTPPELITTAYYYHDAVIMSKIAGVLGNDIDVNRYASLSANIKSSFEKYFIDKSTNIVGNGTQTALSCPLFFKMLDSDLAYEVLNNLVENIDNNDLNLDFGVLGSKFVPNTLAEMGKIDVAYNMINTTDFPGWGHWISQGATTLWEDWKGQSSRNHIFFGDVSAWFYKYLGGIRPVEEDPGYKHFNVKPYFPEDLSWVKSNTNSSYGRIENNWERVEDGITMDISIPFNTSASIILPGGSTYHVLSENKKEISVSEFTDDVDKVSFKLASGNYQIKIGLQKGNL
jgi:alpha-L-rhamnosidase